MRNYFDRSAGGFTLVEILVVVVLVSLLAGVGGQLTVKTYQSRLVERSALDVLLAARYAQLVALERQCPCRLVFDAEKEESRQRFFVMVREFDETTAQWQDVVLRNEYFRPGELAEQVEFEEIRVMENHRTDTLKEEQENVIVFHPDGSAEAAIVQIGDGRRHYTLVVSAATGKARLEYGILKEITQDEVDLDLDQ